MEWLFLLSICFTTASVLCSASDQCSRKSLVTFNTGLLPRIANYTERSRLIPQAINTVDADVICLQEVWYESDVKNILDGVRDKYPHSFSPIHYSADNLRNPDDSPGFFWGGVTNLFSRVGSTACGGSEVASLGWCAWRNCGGQSDRGLLNCLVQSCLRSLSDTSQSCLTCLFVSSSSLSETRRCGAFWQGFNRFNDQGLLVLSKYPLSSPQTTLFNPGVKQLLPRGYIETTVENVGKIVCAHLTANLGEYLEFNTNFNSYQEQQRTEMSILNRTFYGQPHVLLGDLNAGPEDAGRQLTSEFPENYNFLLAAGYTSAYAEQGGNCTYCTENPLLAGTNALNYILDHVMSRHFSSSRIQRVLETLNGQTLSDHYGVKVETCL